MQEDIGLQAASSPERKREGMFSSPEHSSSQGVMAHRLTTNGLANLDIVGFLASMVNVQGWWEVKFNSIWRTTEPFVVFATGDYYGYHFANLNHVAIANEVLFHFFPTWAGFFYCCENCTHLQQHMISQNQSLNIETIVQLYRVVVPPQLLFFYYLIPTHFLPWEPPPTINSIYDNAKGNKVFPLLFKKKKYKLLPQKPPEGSISTLH